MSARPRLTHDFCPSTETSLADVAHVRSGEAARQDLSRCVPGPRSQRWRPIDFNEVVHPAHVPKKYLTSA